MEPGVISATARFVNFELQLQTGELRKNGESLRLPPQPAKVLSYLVSHSGQLVTREELHRQLWNEGTFVDFDQGLNFCIRQIRTVLDDDAECPQFIETVPRRGYRFRAAVEMSGHSSKHFSQSADEATVPVTPTNWSQRKSDTWRNSTQVLLAGIAILLAVMVLLGRDYFRRERNWSTASERRLTANPIEAPVDSATISPDGKYLAYSDKTGVYLRQVDVGEIHRSPLPTEFKLSPSSWLPDSSHLLLTSNESPGHPRTIWKISILGGSPKFLAADAWFPAVSPDGSHVAFLRKGSNVLAVMGLEIWLMKSDGTELRLVTKAQAGDWLGAITWAPNGRRLAFIEGKLRPVVAQLALETVNVEDGNARLVFSNPLMQSTLCWAPDGRILYAEALDENLNDSGIRSIVVDQDTGATRGRSQKLTNGPGLVSSLSISADGRRLSVLRNGIAPQVFVGELGPDLNRLKVRGRLTLDQRPNNPWAWTPDSEAVLFVSRRNGVWNIFKQQIDQNTAELFVGGPDTASDPRLSPDGTNFFYLLSSKHGDLSSPVKLMRIPTSGGPPQEVLEDSGIADIQCSRFPSTLCIFGKPGKGEIAVFSFDSEHGKGRELTRVPDDINWSLSPDGSSLAIVKLFEDQGRIRLISLLGQPSREILVKGGWAAIRSLDWLSDSSGLIVAADNRKGTTSLLHVDKQGNAQELLQGHLGWAIPSPDRRYVAFTEFTGENNVWMLENF